MVAEDLLDRPREQWRQHERRVAARNEAAQREPALDRTVGGRTHLEGLDRGRDRQPPSGGEIEAQIVRHRPDQRQRGVGADEDASTQLTQGGGVQAVESGLAMVRQPGTGGAEPFGQGGGGGASLTHPSLGPENARLVFGPAQVRTGEPPGQRPQPFGYLVGRPVEVECHGEQTGGALHRERRPFEPVERHMLEKV